MDIVDPQPFHETAEKFRAELVLASNEMRDTFTAENLAMLLARVGKMLWADAYGIPAADARKIEVSVQIHERDGSRVGDLATRVA